MAEYTRRWSAWHNKPTQDTPADAAFYEGVEVALDKLLGKDTPGNGEVPSWSTASGGVLWNPPAATTAGTSGTLASRPSAASASGKFYLATDQNVLYFSDGSAWSRIGDPAGATQMWYSASAPTGYVAYDGGTLGGSTGIYADLYAHLGGTTTLPDTRGRMPVGLGTHADVDTIGDNDGAAVGSRRPKHKHTLVQPTVNDPGHVHTQIDAYHNAGNNYNDTAGARALGSQNQNNTQSATTGITLNAGSVGPQTGSEPVDAPAYITFLLIAKL